MTPDHKHDSMTVIDVDRLASQLELLDALHSAASEGQLSRLCTLQAGALKSLLGEIQYLTSETLGEIERHSRPKLRLLRTQESKRRRPAI